MKRRQKQKIIGIILAVVIAAGAYGATSLDLFTPQQTYESISLEEIPPYEDQPYIVINENKPSFNDEDRQRLSTATYEYYSELDGLGRCRYVEACVGTETMPTEERGSIGMIKPSGWYTVRYDFVEGQYLYNRCHLIGFQLTGENANERNLITGTRSMNVDGMLPFEEFVADYVKETGNHVMYRVTPIFEEGNLLANGVQMEAQSVEDDKVSFNIFVYNVQQGVVIDYATGESYAE